MATHSGTDNQLLAVIADYTANTADDTGLMVPDIDTIRADIALIKADIDDIRANTAVIEDKIILIEVDTEENRISLNNIEADCEQIRVELQDSSVDDSIDAGLMGAFPAAGADSRGPVTTKDFVKLILQEVRSLDDGATGIDHHRDGSSGITPFAFTLATEMSGAQDLDGNGEVFGVDFIMDLTLDKYPPGLAGLVTKFYDPGFPGYTAWTGATYSWDALLATLPAGPVADAAALAIVDFKKL